MDWVAAALDLAGGIGWAWIALALAAIGVYTVLALYIRKRIRREQSGHASSNTAEHSGAGDDGAPEMEGRQDEDAGWFSRHFAFYGPVLAPRTTNVRFFDPFRRIATPLKIYGGVGVVVVVIVSVFVILTLLLSLRLTLTMQPEPTAINAPRNLFLIPGLNQFIPFTLPVWIAFVVTLAVHEFGHGILSRVEGIRVRAAGLLVMVLPIGAFVEPDEKELEKAPRASKMRMYGAGIMNNLVVGLLALLLMIAVFSMAVPSATPVINGVYKDYPAYNASIEPGSAVLALNGTPVHDREDVTQLLSTTTPGDTISLTVDHGGEVATRLLTLAEWPSGNRTTGFMGVEYYDARTITEYVKGSFTPPGLLSYLALPFFPSLSGYDLRVLAYPGGNTIYWSEPFWGFWGLVQLLFWLGFINLNVGIFNALPMVPLDGGFIFREALDGLFSRFRIERYTSAVVSTVSFLVLFAMISLLALPWLFTLV